MSKQSLNPVEDAHPQSVKHKWSIFCAWLVALLTGFIGAFNSDGHERAMIFLLGIGVLTLFSGLLQLLTADKNGFLIRLSLSIAGGLLILFVTSAAAQLLC